MLLACSSAALTNFCDISETELKLQDAVNNTAMKPTKSRFAKLSERKIFIFMNGDNRDSVTGDVPYQVIGSLQQLGSPCIGSEVSPPTKSIEITFGHFFRNVPLISSYESESRVIVHFDDSGFAQDMPRIHGYSEQDKRCYGIHDWHAKGRINAIRAMIGFVFLTVGLFDSNSNSDLALTLTLFRKNGLRQKPFAEESVVMWIHYLRTI
jgi:hypothetical protein